MKRRSIAARSLKRFALGVFLGAALFVFVNHISGDGVASTTRGTHKSLANRVNSRSVSISDLRNRVAFVVVTKSATESRFQAQLATWLRTASAVTVFETNAELEGVTFIKAFASARTTFRHSQILWYVLIDDDGYVDVAHLEDILTARGQESPTYMGLHHCQGVDFLCKHGKVKQVLHGWVNGGAGIIFNKAMMDKIDWNASITHYARNWPYKPVASDVAVACTVVDAAHVHNSTVHIQHVDSMFFGSQVKDECECSIEGEKFCSRANTTKPVSLHHLAPRDMLERFNRSLDRNQGRTYCRAGRDSIAFDKGDCVHVDVFERNYGFHCLSWQHVSGPWIVTADVTMCLKVVHDLATCVTRESRNGRRMSHCGRALRWRDLQNPPMWVRDDVPKESKYRAYGRYRYSYNPRILFADGGPGIAKRLSSWRGAIFNGDSNSLNDVKHDRCAVVLRGPNLCQDEKNAAQLIDELDRFDAVFRKANRGQSIDCSGNRTTYGFTHTLNPHEVGTGLDGVEHGIFVPNDDPRNYNATMVNFGTERLSVLSRDFTDFAVASSCPRTLPPKSPVIPGVSSGFYIVLSSLLMCKRVKIFCWEQYGWGKPAYFDTDARVYTDERAKNHFANVATSPENEHCLLEEFMWLQELRETGLVEYTCGFDRSFEAS